LLAKYLYTQYIVLNNSYISPQLFVTTNAVRNNTVNQFFVKKFRKISKILFIYLNYNVKISNYLRMKCQNIKLFKNEVSKY